MKEIIKNNAGEFVVKELVPTFYNKDNCVGVYCGYDIAKEIIEQLVLAGIPFCNIELVDPEFDGYEKEYCIDICNDGFYVEKFWSDKHNRYLFDESDIAFYHCDCSKASMDSCLCDDKRIFFLKDHDEVEEEEVGCLYDEKGEMHGYTFSGSDENGFWSKSFYSTKEYSIDEIKNILSI